MNNKDLILIDKLFGLILLPFSLAFRSIGIIRRKLNPHNNGEILIIKFLGAGNLLSITSTLKKFPCSIITVSANQPTLKEFGIGDKHYFLNDKNPLILFFQVINLSSKLFFYHYSQVINLESESFFAKFLSTIPTSSKLSGISNVHKGLIDSLVYDFYLVTPTLLGKNEIIDLLIQFRPQVNLDIQALVDQRQRYFMTSYLKHVKNARNITIAPTCSPTDNLRRLDIGIWQKICECLGSSLNITVIFPSKTDIQYLEFLQLRDRLPQLNIQLCNFSDFISSIKSCELLITIDSQALHIAQLEGIITIALYGPTSPFGVNLENTSYPLSKSLACSPCTHKYFLPPCAGLAPCMELSSVNLEIFKQVGINFGAYE